MEVNQETTKARPSANNSATPKKREYLMKVLIMTAIYPTPENPAFGSFVKTQVESLKRAGIDVELLVMRGRNRKLLYPKAIYQLRKRLQQGSFDLVHAHFGYVGLVARTQWRVPLVVTYHGDDLLGTINERGKKALWSVLAASACKKLAQHVDAAIVQSQEMAQQLKKSNVFVIPHEVDLEVFKPTEREEARAALGLDPRKKYLLFAANAEIPVKRFSLARAAADVLEQQDGFTELLVVYKEPQWRLALYMSACDVLVFPSYQEGSPNIIKQAMACNLPIVSTDVGDIRQVIGKTKDCYICPPDGRKFASVMREILSRRPRTEGRAQVRHLDLESVSGKIIGVYEQVLKNREKHLAGKTQRDSYAPVDKHTMTTRGIQ
jgi:glycosyltransferase involved in cell wall biosynthesis